MNGNWNLQNSAVNSELCMMRFVNMWENLQLCRASHHTAKLCFNINVASYLYNFLENISQLTKTPLTKVSAKPINYSRKNISFGRETQLARHFQLTVGMQLIISQSLNSNFTSCCSQSLVIKGLSPLHLATTGRLHFKVSVNLAFPIPRSLCCQDTGGLFTQCLCVFAIL